MGQDRMTARSVILRGGGRWSGVLASVLADILPAGSRLIWVAGQGYETALETVARLQENASELAVQVVRQIMDMTPGLQPDLAIVASATPAHGSDLRDVLARALPRAVLVEKPLASSPAEADAMLALCGGQTTLYVNYEFRLASYIEQLAELTRGKPVRCVSVQWCDPAAEDRGHSRKSVNWSTHIAYDQASHVWSLIDRILPGRTLHHPEARFIDEGRRVSCQGWLHEMHTAARTSFSFEISRRARLRERVIRLELETNDVLNLSFNPEPGALTFNNQHVATQEFWDSQPRPLGRVLRAVLDLPAREDAMPRETALALISAEACHGALAFAEAFKTMIDAAAFEMLASESPEKRLIAQQELFAHQLSTSSFYQPDEATLEWCGNQLVSGSDRKLR